MKQMRMSSALAGILSCLIVSLVGSIVFFLVSPPHSYVLFILFSLLAIVIATNGLGNTFISRIHFKVSIIKIQILFFVAALALLAVQLAGIHFGLIGGLLYVIVDVFALGTSVLSILKFKSISSKIEFVALSYSVSLALLAVIGTIALILPSSLRGVFTSLITVFLAFSSIIVRIKDKSARISDQHEFVIKHSELVLLLTISIFVYFYLYLYPAISNILGHDIFRNFLEGLFYTKDKLGDFYVTSPLYPMFGIYQSSLFYIIEPSVEVFQTIMISLNIFVILSFYVMASQYLKRYGDLVPSIATLIWATFSGFGWLGFLMQEIKVPDVSMMSLIIQSDVLSYGDITWRRLFFYLSMEVSLSLVFVTLYLLSRNDLRKNTKIVLMSLIMTPLSLMHPYGSLLLYVVFLCYAVIGSVEQDHQLKYGALSLVLASFASLGLTYLLYIVAPTYLSLDFRRFILNVLVGLVLIATISMKGLLPKGLKSAIMKTLTYRRILSAATVVLLLYFASLLLWLNGNVSFNFVELDSIGYVPWFMYPVKLGMIGILAIVSVYFCLMDSEHSHRELGIMFASALMLIFIARLASTIEMQYSSEFTFNTGSWFSESIINILLSLREERMFELLKVPLAMIASTVFAKSVLTRIKRKNNLLNMLVTFGLVSLLLISGISSTLLGFEYFTDQVRVSQPSQPELDILSEMRSEVYQKGKSVILGLNTPFAYMDSTGAIVLLTESQAAWISKSPEFPLLATRYSPTTPTYIYVNNASDTTTLSNDEGSYLKHLYDVAQNYLENQNVKLKVVENGSSPTSNGDAALVLPYDSSIMAIQRPYHQEESKLDLALFFEESMQSANFYKEPIRYNNVQVDGSGRGFFNGIDSYVRINGTETNPDKISVELDFQPLNLTRIQVLLSKFEVGTPPKKSWEIVQYGKRLGFKISPDGDREEVLLTDEILKPDTEYIVRCEYDGNFMKIFVNDILIVSKPYNEGIYKSNTDIVLGAELYNNKSAGFSNIAVKYIRVFSSIVFKTEPIFNAYDILSTAEINYTTILSSDSSLDSYSTIILPYDDITTLNVLTQLITNNRTAHTRNVIILNTNGYGPLLNIFGGISSETFYANRALSNEYSILQPAVEVKTIKPNRTVEVKENYTDNLHLSPLIMKVTREGLTLIYVDVYPLIGPNTLSYYTLYQSIRKALSDYMEIYDETTVSPWFKEPSLLFTSLHANGSINVLSSSIASLQLAKINTVSISSGKSNVMLSNVTDVSINGFNEVKVYSTDVVIQKGYGFYATLIAHNPSIALSSNKTINIEAGGRSLEAQNPLIKIEGNVTILVRQPKVSIDGETIFDGFYFMHSSTITTDGRTTELKGKIQVDVYVSDVDTIALPYSLNSPITVKYEPPLLQFDEIPSLYAMVPNIIMVTIFAIIILLINLLAHKKEQDIQFPRIPEKKDGSV